MRFVKLCCGCGNCVKLWLDNNYLSGLMLFCRSCETTTFFEEVPENE